MITFFNDTKALQLSVRANKYPIVLFMKFVKKNGNDKFRFFGNNDVKIVGLNNLDAFLLAKELNKLLKNPKEKTYKFKYKKLVYGIKNKKFVLAYKDDDITIIVYLTREEIEYLIAILKEFAINVPLSVSLYYSLQRNASNRNNIASNEIDIDEDELEEDINNAENDTNDGENSSGNEKENSNDDWFDDDNDNGNESENLFDGFDFDDIDNNSQSSEEDNIVI